MADAQAKFLTGNLFRHVTVMSLTASLGLMMVFVVDFVDMIFISMLGKAELAAAVGYAGAILFFTTSFGIGMAIAAGAMVARALGAGDRERAVHTATIALIYGFVFGGIFAAVVWLNLGTLAGLVGAEGDTLALAVHYLAIIVPSLPLLIVGMIGGAILRAHGEAQKAMMATIVGGLVNAVLDPILIFGLGLELTGAALASVAARFAIAFVALRPILKLHAGTPRPTRAQFFDDLKPPDCNRNSRDPDAIGDACGAGVCDAVYGAVWGGGGGGDGDCWSVDAGGFWGAVCLVGRGGADHRTELWRGSTRPGAAGLL